MAPATSANMPGAGKRARRRPTQELNWDQHRGRILYLYETEGKPLREVHQIMRDDHGFDATPKMYKTRFKAWDVTKYNVDSTTKFFDEQTKRLRAKVQESCIALRTSSQLNPTKPQLNRQKVARVDVGSQRLRGSGSTSIASSFPIPSQSTLLDIPYHSDNSSHQHTAASSIVYTPERSRTTSRPSSSDRASILTPESYVNREGCDPSPLNPLEPDAALEPYRGLSGDKSQGGLFAPRPKRPYRTPRSIPQFAMQDKKPKEDSIAGQILDQTMGFSWPSNFRTPTPSKTFQDQMAAPIHGFQYPAEALKQKLANIQSRCTKRVPDLISPQPETWTSLCLYVNILLGEDRNAEAKQAMAEAARTYLLLVQEANDELLSILNLVLTNLFLHGKEALAAELLRQAQTAASCFLQEDDPIMVSIEFMIAIALKKTKTCGIKILRLRQVVEEMKMIWGENHRFCITAEYHLAWRLAMEPDLRSEALGILGQTQVRAEKIFDPLHMQTVALISTQARILGHLGRHLEAERTMSEALQRICRWEIHEDYPYYVEAKRRYNKFLEELDRVSSP